MPHEHSTIEVGDYVIGYGASQLGVIRKITRKRKTGFTWLYPFGSRSDFWSENSSDPFFVMGWTHVPAAIAEQPYMQQILKTMDKINDMRARLELAADEAPRRPDRAPSEPIPRLNVTTQHHPSQNVFPQP